MPAIDPSKFQYSPDDFDYLLKSLASKKPETLVTTNGMRNLMDNAFNELKKKAETNARISDMKAMLGRDMLFEGEMLTAINGGVFPNDEEQMAGAKLFYKKFFGHRSSKKKVAKKAVEE